MHRARHRIGHDVRHGHAERIRHAVRHFITGDKLPARGVAGDHYGFQVRESLLVGEAAKNLVDEIE
jgi:hypothetical protein